MHMHMKTCETMKVYGLEFKVSSITKTLEFYKTIEVIEFLKFSFKNSLF